LFWRSKKFIVIAVIVAVLAVGAVAGVAVAQTSNPDAQGKSLIARVAAILGIDEQRVQDAFDQAQKDMKNEALDTFLQKQVESGKITQEQADADKQWLQSKPDTSAYEEALKQWQESRPDLKLLVPDLDEWQQAKPDVELPGLGRFGRIGPMLKGGLLQGR